MADAATSPRSEARPDALREAMRMARLLRDYAEEHPEVQQHDTVPGKKSFTWRVYFQDFF